MIRVQHIRVSIIMKRKSFKKKGKAGEKFFEMYYLYLCRFHIIFM